MQEEICKSKSRIDLKDHVDGVGNKDHVMIMLMRMKIWTIA